MFRRVRGMIAHGLWDMSVFLPPPSGGLAAVNLLVHGVQSGNRERRGCGVPRRDHHVSYGSADAPEGGI